MKTESSWLRWGVGIFFGIAFLVLILRSPLAALVGLGVCVLTLPVSSERIWSRLLAHSSIRLQRGILAGMMVLFLVLLPNDVADQTDPSLGDVGETLPQNTGGEVATDISETPDITPAMDTVSEEAVAVASVVEGLVRVVEIVDGDTLKIQDGETRETVRLVGIDTPEVGECISSEATDMLKLLTLNQQVSMRPDETQNDRDRYGRLLRFVAVDGEDVGLVLLQAGLAEARLYSSTPHIYHEMYTAAETEAKQNGLGLWATDACLGGTQPTQEATKSQQDTVERTDVGNRACNGPDLDCKDFATQAEAQAFFDGCGFSATYDPMRLDSVKEGDGVPCESLP